MRRPRLDASDSLFGAGFLATTAGIATFSVGAALIWIGVCLLSAAWFAARPDRKE